MSTIINQRMTAQMDGSFVVFVIGMRINNFWNVKQWLPVAMAMPKMIKELEEKPESGFLGYEQWFGRTAVLIQYWESVEKLQQYASAKDGLHFPAWVAFNKRIKNSKAVGIYHETYKVQAGEYECIYHNMPPIGLGKVGKLMAAKGNYQSASDRFTAHSRR